MSTRSQLRALRQNLLISQLGRTLNGIDAQRVNVQWRAYMRQSYAE